MPSAAATAPSAPACCDTSEFDPCTTCSRPPVPDRRTEIAKLHADGRTTPAIGRAMGLNAYCVRRHLKALGLVPHRPAVIGHTRPGNTSPERTASIAVGVLIDRVDGAFAAITAAVLEELEAFLPETDLDLAPLASSLAVRVVQASLLVWFPEAFDEDPAAVRAGKVDVLKRRAEMERKAGRPELAAHWDEMAGSVDTGAGLIPANGVLQRVSPDGFRLLAARLRGDSMDG